MNRLLGTALRLGRVSNLPTVWTNVAVGVALNGGSPDPRVLLPLTLALSLFYVGGMYLNDAFDHRWDEQHRPERPIPAGEVPLSLVFGAGFGFLGLGLILLAAFGGFPSLQAGLALGALIVLYDATHKWNPLGPLVMGLCRVAVYFTAAISVDPRIGTGVYVGAALLLLYLIGLTALAKREAERPGLPALIGALIAGISLLDAGLLLSSGHPVAALLAVGAFFLTRRLQRRIAGT